MANFTERMVRAATLNVALYKEVKADTSALGQATAVVALSSIAAGLGSIVPGGVAGLILITIATLIGWYVWAYLTYFIGVKLLPEPQTQANHIQLLRTIHFASSPGLIRVVGLIPGLTGIVFLIASIWMLVAMVIAVCQALDYTSTLRAVGVCVIGWIIQALVLALLFAIVGRPPAPV